MKIEVNLNKFMYNGFREAGNHKSILRFHEWIYDGIIKVTVFEGHNGSFWIEQYRVKDKLKELTLVEQTKIELVDYEEKKDTK